MYLRAMLHTLRVKNLAIVENVSVELEPGLNVVTGETGAGKSILVGALNLILGERADKSLIRSGEDKCGVEAVFVPPAPGPIDAILDEHGIDRCEEGQLIVRRIISSSGAGKNLVNGCNATLQTLKQIGDLLIDMHGPHDHQSLLNRSFQLDVLDAFAQLSAPRASYEREYRAMLDLQSALADLDCDDEQVAQQIDLLSYQVKEIEEADLTDQDDTELEKEHARVANAQRILELAGAINNALSEGEVSAFDAMVQVRNALTEIAPMLDDATEWREEAESITIQIQELAASISSTVQSIDADPQRLQWLENRMTLLHGLKRKYGATVKDILAFLEDARVRLHGLETRSERIAKIAADLEKARGQARATGKKLSARRSTAGKSLAKAITAELRDLGFAHGTFDVGLTTGEPGPTGLDDIEFGFAPNVGEPMRPLRAIASSGEISRVMLATKSVLAAHDRIPVLVFDEIDANVGGETANAVGDKLATVAAAHQVLCITHLPQVAVHGGSHYLVSKDVEGGRTRTVISSLSSEERTAEVARMLGGRDVTSVAMQHAQEMLEGKAS